MQVLQVQHQGLLDGQPEEELADGVNDLVAQLFGRRRAVTLTQAGLNLNRHDMTQQRRDLRRSFLVHAGSRRGVRDREGDQLGAPRGLALDPQMVAQHLDERQMAGGRSRLGAMALQPERSAAARVVR